MKKRQDRREELKKGEKGRREEGRGGRRKVLEGGEKANERSMIGRVREKGKEFRKEGREWKEGEKMRENM